MKMLLGLLGKGAVVLLGKAYRRFCREFADIVLQQGAGLKKLSGKEVMMD